MFWLLGIFIWGAFMWWWMAIVLSISFACYALVHLLKGELIRATCWGCLSAAGWFWLNQSEWIPHPYQVEKWLEGSIHTVLFVVGLIVLYHLCQMFHRWRRGEPVLSFGQPPEEDVPLVTMKIEPGVKPRRQQRQKNEIVMVDRGDGVFVPEGGEW